MGRVRDEVVSAVLPLLEEGELLEAYTLGIQQESPYHTAVALTSRRLRIASPTGGRNIEFDNLRSIRWSGLWARLNIETAAPRKRIVISVFGREWKDKARALAESARRRIPARRP